MRRLLSTFILKILHHSINTERPLPKGNAIIAGFFSATTGLGEGARRFFRKLKMENFDVHDAKINLLLKTEDFETREIWPKEAGQHGIVIFHVNPDYFNLISMRIRRKNFLSRRVVGYWVWELEKVPKKWIRALKSVDEVWVPTQFVADALRKVSSEKPIHVVPYPYDISETPVTVSKNLFPQFAKRTLVFFMYDVGSAHARKNPEAVIEAFRRAAKKEAVLIIKINNEHLWPESLRRLQEASKDISNIFLVREKFSRGEMQDLMARVDIVISLHRSEGYGLLMLEAMAAGKPVIATGFSGNLDFMHPDCSILIDYTLIPVVDEQGIYNHPQAVWAEPNMEQAAERLRYLIENPAERASLGKAARQHIVKLMSSENWLKRLPKSFWESLS